MSTVEYKTVIEEIAAKIIGRKIESRFVESLAIKEEIENAGEIYSTSKDRDVLRILMAHRKSMESE